MNPEMETTNGSPAIVFFDLETTVPNRGSQRFHVLEFGAIVVCPKKVVELDSFTTLIKPRDLSVVRTRSSREEGITRDLIAQAPKFGEVADRIYDIMHGRIWAGHNIQRFDIVRIRELFSENGRSAPEPVGIIDSLGLLTERFGKRAGNMKMASLMAYFGLGQQKHRSLDDVRMNLEVLKHCATVLLLESSLPSILSGRWQSPPTTRSRSNSLKLGGKEDQAVCRKSPPASPGYQRSMPYTRSGLGKVTESVKNMLWKAQGNQSFQTMLRHSQSILR